MNQETESPIMKFFRYDHLPQFLKDISKPFGDLAKMIDEKPTSHHAEKATALRKLLEAKDAAVRAAL